MCKTGEDAYITICHNDNPMSPDCSFHVHLVGLLHKTLRNTICTKQKDVLLFVFKLKSINNNDKSDYLIFFHWFNYSFAILKLTANLTLPAKKTLFRYCAIKTCTCKSLYLHVQLFILACASIYTYMCKSLYLHVQI